MADNPVLGWIAIGIIVIIFIGINVSMIGLLRDAPKLRSKSASTSDKLRGVVGMIRNPYEEEDRQLKELDDLVNSLKNQSQDDSSSQPPN